MQVNILGTPYDIYERSKEEDEYLRNTPCDGYCDKTSKLIVITKEDGNLEKWEVYRKSLLRHEIIHAFLFESGLHENWTHPDHGHDETYVDWIATQGEKIYKAWREAGAV